MRELHVVVDVAKALLQDFRMHHPTYSAIEMERDMSHIVKMAQYRGMAYFTITLPACADVLHSTLESGEFPTGHRNPSLGKRSPSDRRPRFMGGIYELILDEYAMLRQDADTLAIASLRQFYLFAKKLKLECKESAREKALHTFRLIEQSLPAPNPQTFEVDIPHWKPRHGHPLWGAVPMADPEPSLLGSPVDLYGGIEGEAWDRLHCLVRRLGVQLGELDPYSIQPKHGPGATYDREGIKDDFTFWPWKLQQVFPYDWHASYNYGHVPFAEEVGCSESVRQPLEREFPSRVLSVPKTQKGPRLIAAEPSAHQWIQGGIQRWLEERVKRTVLGRSINFSNQNPSRELALKASKEGTHSTIDLSSASDRLSCRLVEYVFQANITLLDALHASRTRYTEVCEGDYLVLRKFATQGSACTFPVQTIVYATLALFAVLEARGLDQESLSFDELASLAEDEVCVFGDDIIVASDASELLVRILSSCGLSVNASKSFFSGKFRESCGMDAYDGHDVTPAYYRHIATSAAPESIVSSVECSNNFFKRGYWHTANVITTTFAGFSKLIPVTAVGSGLLGVESYCGTSLGHLKESDRCKAAEALQTPHILVLDMSASKAVREHQVDGQLASFLRRKEEPRWYDGVLDVVNPLGTGQPVKRKPSMGKRWVPKYHYET